MGVRCLMRCIISIITLLSLPLLGPPLSHVGEHRPGRGGFIGLVPAPSLAWRRVAVVRDARGGVADPAAPSELLQTLRADHLNAPILAPAEPRWVRLRFAAAPRSALLSAVTLY